MDEKTAIQELWSELSQLQSSHNDLCERFIRHEKKLQKAHDEMCKSLIDLATPEE